MLESKYCNLYVYIHAISNDMSRTNELRVKDRGECGKKIQCRYFYDIPYTQGHTGGWIPLLNKIIQSSTIVCLNKVFLLYIKIGTYSFIQMQSLMEKLFLWIFGYFNFKDLILICVLEWYLLFVCRLYFVHCPMNETFSLLFFFLVLPDWTPPISFAFSLSLFLSQQ
jgi:hypothetical protein